VRDALAHLYDNAYLSRHPLLPALVRRHIPDPVARSQHLRSLIIEAINGLRPPPSVAPHTREWRPYGILVYRYLDGMGDEQIGRKLSISERQLFRDLKAGVELLAAFLQAQATPPADEDEDALATSLKGVGLALERVDLRLLAQEGAAVAQGLATTLGKGLRLEVEDEGPMVVADAALGRQALISALAHALRHAAGDVVVQRVSGVKTEVLALRYRRQPAADDAAGEALSLARQLLEQQGGLLQCGGDEERLICLHWRRFEEPPILVVEDDPGMLRLFSRYLDGHGYRVIAIADGREAVRLARENEARLVLLDVMMRAIDGWSVLQQLRADPGTRHIPVLVCSVINEPQLATALGAAGLLKKPVSCEQLLSEVAALVGI
jgi:CheY-like chemotaxis protein